MAPKNKRQYLIIGVLLAIAVVSANIFLHHNLRSNYSKIRQFDVLETLPSTSVAKMLWLELDSVAADYYYLKAIQHFGTSKYMKGNAPHPLLLPILELATDMDPNFTKAYTFGGLTLNLMGMDATKASQFLYKGRKNIPDNYQIGFLLAFNLYFYEQKFAEAATIFHEISKMKEAPDFIGPLAAKLAAEGGSPEIGLTFIDQIIESTDDETLLESYIERHNQLLMEIHIKHLQTAVNTYNQQNGSYPQDLSTLVTSGLIKEIPEEPFGGHYQINGEGKVSSSSDKEFLRLNDIIHKQFEDAKN